MVDPCWNEINLTIIYKTRRGQTICANISMNVSVSAKLGVIIKIYLIKYGHGKCEVEQ